MATGQIFWIISLILISFAVFISFRQYFRLKIKSILFLSLTLLSIEMGILFEGLFYILYIKKFIQITVLSYVVSTFMVTFFIETISRDKTGTIYFFISTLLTTTVTIFLFDEQSYYYIGNEAHLQNKFIVIFEIMQIYAGLLILAYLTKIFLNAPPTEKFSAFMVLIGTLFFTLISSIIITLGFTPRSDGLHLLTESVGLAILIYFWNKNPKLAFVLPFRAFRISVFNTKSGLPLYSYIWNKDTEHTNEMLYSGLIQGVSTIAKETMDKGAFQELRMERAILIMQPGNNSDIAAVILTSRSSSYLRESLMKFTERFEERFEKEVENPLDYRVFRAADEIVEEYFNLVPEFGN